MGKRNVASAADASAAWRAAMQSGTTADKYKKGVQRVTVSPTQLAATPEAMRAYQEGVQQSIDSGRRAASLNGTTLESWRAQTLANGPTGLANAAKKGGPKYDKAVQSLQSVWQAAADAAGNIPRIPGDEQNAQDRWMAAYRVMKAAKGRAKGG